MSALAPPAAAAMQRRNQSEGATSTLLVVPLLGHIATFRGGAIIRSLSVRIGHQQPRSRKPDLVASVPRDDLVLALMNIRRIEQVTGAAADQKFRTPCADDVMAPAPHRGFARLVFRQQRKVEDIAPHLPGGREFLAVEASAKRDVQ